MRFMEEFKTGMVQSYGPAGTPHKAIYVDNRDVFDLLVILKNNGMGVDKEFSEAIYSQTRVPLGALFPVNKRPTGYYLKGDNLEINLENYNHSDANRPKRGPIMIGGSSNRITAVNCKIIQEASVEDPYESLDIFLSTCTLVGEFYNSLKSEESLRRVRELVARG